MLVCLVLRRGRRLRRRLDDLPAALGEIAVQPHAARLEPLPGGRGARVRGLPARRHQLHHHRDELARAGDEALRRADRGVDDRRGEHPVHGLGRSADRGRRHAVHGPAGRDGLLRSGPRRRPGPLAAPVLVLRAPGGLRGAAAGAGHRGRDHHGVLAQEAVCLQDGALHRLRHRRAELHGVGAPPVRRRHRSRAWRTSSRSRRC